MQFILTNFHVLLFLSFTNAIDVICIYISDGVLLQVKKKRIFVSARRVMDEQGHVLTSCSWCCGHHLLLEIIRINMTAVCVCFAIVLS